MAGPTLKLDVTSPGQKSVEGTTTAVKQLAAALRDLPKASAELLKLQQALAGGTAAPSGLKAGAGEMKELVGEIKNLSAQLNTSFLSLEETIKKGWAKAAKAQTEGEAKSRSARSKPGASAGAEPLTNARYMQELSRQYLEQAEMLSKVQAAGDRRRLKRAAGSEAGTQQLLYGSDVAVLAQMGSYYKQLEAADTSAAATLSRQLLANAESVSKARAAAHQKLLQKSSGSEAATKSLLYSQGPESQAAIAQMASYYKKLEAADTSASTALARKILENAEKVSQVRAKAHQRELSKASGSEGATRGLLYRQGPESLATLSQMAGYYKQLEAADTSASAALARKVLENAEKISQARAKAHQAALKKSSGSEEVTRGLLYSQGPESLSALAQMASYYKKLEAADTAASNALARKILENAEKVSQARAKAHQAALRKSSGSEAVTRGLLYNQGPESLSTLAQMGSYYRGLEAADAAAAKAAQGAKKLGADTGGAGDHAAKAAPKFRLLSASMSDAHSAARGLASGFGGMFLTWGRIMPLLAGAAISNSFVQSLKVGADVTQDLETVRVLSQESASAIAGLEKQLVSLGANGPFGPREVAEAMKVLSLAGLGAQQVSSTIKPALDLAVVGQTTIEKSASALVAVGTAYGYQAEQFGLVGDAMSKAAAISMSSVDGMMESFRSASVVGQQYKVSLNDTATGLAILANVGIRNSAAGTSIRQMYSELSGASSNTRRAMKELGVEVIDTATGGMKPLLTIVRDLNAALSTKDAKAYQRAIQDMSNERGAKSLVALLEAFASKAKEAGSTVETELDRINQAIKNAPGFSAISAAQLSATPQNQMKAVASSFQTALFEAFKAIEPTIMVITSRLKAVFGSDEFRATVASLASAVGNLSVFMLQQIETLKYLALGYGVWKGASVGLAAVNVLVGAGTALMYQNAVASGVAAAAAGTASTAARTAWLSFLGPVGIAIGAVTALWVIYKATSNEASTGAVEAARIRNEIVIKSLTDEAARLDEVNDKLRIKLGLEALYTKRPEASDAENQMEDEYKRLQRREQFLMASPAVGTVKESELAELKRVRDEMDRMGREMYDQGRRVAEGTIAVTQKSAENATLVLEQNRVFGDVPVDDSREKAEKAKRDAAEQAAIDARFAAVRREYQLRQQFITGSQSQEDQLIEAWHAAKYTTVTEYEAKKVAAAEKLHTDELANLKKFVENSKALIAAMGDHPKARTAVAELATEAERAERDIAFRTEMAKARAAKKHQEMLKPMELATMPELPKVARLGPAWQQQLEDWRNVKEQLTRDRDEFMTGWVDRGRTMWSEWLKSGKLSFSSLKDLFQQTLADITYKRFIATPLANMGEKVFDTLLSPVSRVQPGSGDATTDLRASFQGLRNIADQVGSGLSSLGGDFWRLFVQAGQGLAAMLSSSGATGAGSFLSKVFGGGGEGPEQLGEAGGYAMPSAMGNAFNNGLYAFANGGLPSNSVISSPHFFRFGAGGSNLGVAGEAGAEAIMPLSRGPRGDLGVRMHGGGGGGGQVVAKTSVVIENHGNGAEPKVSRETQPDGSELIRVVLNATAKDISRGGAVRKSMQNVSSKRNLPRY